MTTVYVSYEETPEWRAKYLREEGKPIPVPTFRVALPHQCDAWVITDSESSTDAVAELDRFINTLQEARTRLVALIKEKEQL